MASRLQNAHDDQQVILFQPTDAFKSFINLFRAGMTASGGQRAEITR